MSGVLTVPRYHSGCVMVLHEAISTGSSVYLLAACVVAWHCRLTFEDVRSGSGFHGHIPRTAIFPRVMRRAVMFGSVLISTGRLQYCPAPRIPLDIWSGTCRGLPAYTRAAVPGMAGVAFVPAMIVAYVFMVSFLFTVVNTQYGAGRFIETDLASGFAASGSLSEGEFLNLRETLPKPRYLLSNDN
jgi:hypothetical protein